MTVQRDGASARNAEATTIPARFPQSAYRNQALSGGLFERIRSLTRTIAKIASRARAGDPDYPPAEALGWVEKLATKVQDDLSNDVGDEVIDLTTGELDQDNFMSEPEWVGA